MPTSLVYNSRYTSDTSVLMGKLVYSDLSQDITGVLVTQTDQVFNYFIISKLLFEILTTYLCRWHTPHHCLTKVLPKAHILLTVVSGIHHIKEK